MKIQLFLFAVLAFFVLAVAFIGIVQKKFPTKPRIPGMPFAGMIMPKFLGTFSAYPGLTTSNVVAKGANNNAPCYVEHVLPQVLANNDTVTMQAPKGYYDWCPQLISCWSNAAPRTPQTAIAITNHDPVTGITTLTASGAVATKSTITLAYMPVTQGV